MIDESSDLLKKILKSNKEIAEELKDQKTLMNKLGDQVEKTKVKVQSNSSIFDDVITKTSNWCLFVFILIEILAIVFLIII